MNEWMDEWMNIYLPWLTLTVQVGGLVLNDELTSMAQQWAEHLASIKTLQHSNQKYRGQPVGENVAAKSGTGQVDYTGQCRRPLIWRPNTEEQ